MEKVIIYLPNVEIFLNDLVDLLFEKEYFGFKQNAVLYTTKIKNFIEENISKYPAKISLEEFTNPTIKLHGTFSFHRKNNISSSNSSPTTTLTL